LKWNESRIRYLGEIADDELAPFLGAVACMVSPSSYEGFGLTFLEAMAAGCPVVGVANSSVPEVVADAGILVREPSVHALADAIETLVTDLGLAADLSRRGVERAALFSWKETARLTRAAYELALGAVARPS
jgi:glycosyltransferase involved in cell wall biosynthesis